MLSKKYRLSYLPLFYEDLDERITYIVEKLKNPKAASDLSVPLYGNWKKPGTSHAGSDGTKKAK